MAIIDKTIADLLKSIGIKLKPGVATDVTRLPDIKSSFNLDFSKFGSKADPKQMKKLIETDANFVFKANEAEKEQFTNNIAYLKSEYPELFSKSETITSAKTGEKLVDEAKSSLGPLTETEASLGVTTPEHRKLVQEYLDAKKEHLDYVEKAKNEFNKTYKHGDIPMSSESRWALEDELKKKGLNDEQLYDLFHNAEKDTWYWDYTKNRGAFRPMPPEEFYKNVQDELKKTHDIDHNMDFYINFANQLKKPEFASGGRVGYGAGGDVTKAAIKALEKAKALRLKWSKALDEGDWMSAAGFKKEADRIETGYFLNKDPKDVTFPDILDYHKATHPDDPRRYSGYEGEHWVDRARNKYEQIKKSNEEEGIVPLLINRKPTTTSGDFKKGGKVGYAYGGISTSITPKSITSSLGRTLEKGIGSMFKKKK